MLIFNGQLPYCLHLPNSQMNRKANYLKYILPLFISQVHKWTEEQDILYCIPFTTICSINYAFLIPTKAGFSDVIFPLHILQITVNNVLRTVALTQSAMTASFLTPKTNKRSDLFNRKNILVVRETVRTHDFMVENVRFIRTNPPQTKVLVLKPYLLTQGYTCHL